MIDEELVGRIEALLSSDPSPERIAEEVTEYFEEIFEFLDEPTTKACLTTLPALLDDGSMIEVGLSIHRVVTPEGDAAFSFKVAGSSDEAQIVGLLELAKHHVLSGNE